MGIIEVSPSDCSYALHSMPALGPVPAREKIRCNWFMITARHRDHPLDERAPGGGKGEGGGVVEKASGHMPCVSQSRLKLVSGDFISPRLIKMKGDAGINYSG